MSGESNSKSHKESELPEILYLEEKGDVEGLIAILEHSNKGNVVKLAINALGRLKDDRAVQPLIEWGLKNPLVSIRAAAVRALGEIGNDNAVEPVMDVLLKDKTIRTEAVETLGKLRAGSVVTMLAFVVNDEEEDQQTREKALESLGNIADEEAIISLVMALGGSLSDKASTVLKEVGEWAVRPLISALDSDNEGIMWKAVVV